MTGSERGRVDRFGAVESRPRVVTLRRPVNPPANTAYPVITLPVGRTAPNIGDTLSISNGIWTGSFPMTFTYQWKKCDSPTGSCFSIPGATRNTFTVTTDLYGMTIRAEVTAKNSAAAVAQNSESTKVVSAIAPLSRATPQITGTVMVGQTLALTAGTWDGSLPLTFTYSWRRCNPPGDLASCVQIPGATTATYIPVVADIGQTIRVWITGTNPAGSDTAVTNHTFPVVDKPHFAPTSSDSPLIVGTLEVGGVLTASVGTFTGDAPIATKQQWQRCNAVGSACKDIKGATKQIYHPTSSDVGSTLRLVVTATNLYGKATSISDVTEPVIPQLPHIKGETIIGSSKADYLIGTIHDDTIRGQRRQRHDQRRRRLRHDRRRLGQRRDQRRRPGAKPRQRRLGLRHDLRLERREGHDRLRPGTGPRRHRPVRRRAQLRGRAGRQQLRQLVRKLARDAARTPR